MTWVDEMLFKTNNAKNLEIHNMFHAGSTKNIQFLCITLFCQSSVGFISLEYCHEVIFI